MNRLSGIYSEFSNFDRMRIMNELDEHIDKVLNVECDIGLMNLNDFNE